MRPVPRSRHLAAVLIFAALSAGSGVVAFFDDHLSESQMNIASAALRRHQHDLFPHDPVFGSKLRHFQTPSFQVLLELVLVPSEYRDPTLPFRILTGVVVMVYLCGMYALLYRQCRSWSMSAFVAVLSCKIAWTIGWSYWGVGVLASVSPQTLVQAVVPLIVLAFLRNVDRWQVLLVFGVIGLCANMHLVTAMNLTIILLVVYLARRRFRASSWPMAIACGICALLGASLYVGYYYGLRLQMPSPAAATAGHVAYEAMRTAGLNCLYPELLKDLLNWLPWVAVLVIPAVAVLSRLERFRLRDPGVWVWFIIAGLFVAFGLQGISQLVGLLSGRFPPVIDFSQAASLVMLPLYVLFAQALTNLFRMVRHNRGLLRWACAVLLAAWMIPSDNLRYVRRQSYRLGGIVMGEDNLPEKFRKNRRRHLRRVELTRIADWARNDTPIDAVFLTDRLAFRMRARRSIVASSDDVKYFFYLAPWRLAEWSRRVHRQGRALSPGATSVTDPRQVQRFVRDLAAKPDFKGASQWYVILRAETAPPRPGVLEPVTSENWGEYYRVYQVH